MVAPSWNFSAGIYAHALPIDNIKNTAPTRTLRKTRCSLFVNHPLLPHDRRAASRDDGAAAAARSIAACTLAAPTRHRAMETIDDRPSDALNRETISIPFIRLY